MYMFLLGILVIILFCVALYGYIKDKHKNSDNKFTLKTAKERAKVIGSRFVTDDLQKMLDNAKNPWHMSVAVLQAVRIIGAIAGVILGIILYFILGMEWAIFTIVIVSGVSWFYPIYYNNGVGKEREEEWNKLYEFIWVIESNFSQYDVKQSYLNIRDYLYKNYPEDKELIQGFTDFANYYNGASVDPYLKKYYNFPIPLEVVKIGNNINSTGVSATEQLDQLREFVITSQDRNVTKVLSNVSTYATLSTLPMLMFSLILALMVPMFVQFLGYMK